MPKSLIDYKCFLDVTLLQSQAYICGRRKFCIQDAKNIFDLVINISCFLDADSLPQQMFLRLLALAAQQFFFSALQAQAAIFLKNVSSSVPDLIIS